MEQNLIGTSNRETAMMFLECFCTGNVEALVPLLDTRLRVRGPLHQFNSRTEYVESLRADPPAALTYNVLNITQGEDSVAVFYEYGKPDGALTVAQLFRFRDHRITEMCLVFDTDGFEEP